MTLSPRRLLSFSLLAAAFFGALAGLARADEGMWLLNRPPLAMLKEKYGFEPDAKWLEHAQKAAVRMGASAAFVSADGLIMTNHHVGSGAISKLSTKERDLLKTGFYAKTRAEELKCADTEVSVLWTIEDVSAKINAAAMDAKTPAAANDARRKAMTALEQEQEKATGLKCSVVSLYNGARYHLYSYKRFTDVRLVMAPEEQAAFFGGDTDNFEFPRFDLDMTFFRAYENDQPARPEHFFKWSAAGAKENEPVFVVGHPGSTRRLYTVDHLRFLRDVAFPLGLERLWRREVQLQTFAARSDENNRISNGDRRGVENSRKRNTGQLAGVLDPAVFKKKADAEKALRAKIDANPEWKAKYADGWDTISGAYKKYREFYERQSVLGGVSGGSSLFSAASTIVRLADELPKPSADRLREYRDTALDSVYRRLYSPAPIYDALEVMRLESGLSLLAEKFGAEDPTVVLALNGKSPRARAEELVKGCRLKDVAERKRLVEGGKDAVGSSDDPMIALAKALDPESRSLRKRSEDEIDAVERDAYAKVAAANFIVHGEDMYPDATGTLRLAIGTVKGYESGGEKVPAFTTIGGTFERMEARKGQKDFWLPDSWLKAKDKLDLSIPYNFVCTNDIIGGNSGSPVINKAGEIVGLIFDGNLESLATDIVFDDNLCRAVAVDSRAIIECLRKIYDAGPLADELQGKAVAAK